MKAPLALLIVAGMLAVELMVAVRAEDQPARPAKPKDPAEMFMKQEAERAARVRELMFNTVRLIEPPPPVQRPNVEARIVRRNAVPAAHFRVTRDAAAGTDLDDDDVVDPSPPAQAERIYFITPEDFDRWVLGVGGESDLRRRFETLLAREVSLIETGKALAPIQKAKLQLAGRGDIKRLFDRLAEKRRESAAGMDREAYIAFRSELMKLNPMLNAGPFHDVESLFNKTWNAIREHLNREATAVKAK
jgi:hypothetical protein